MTETKAIDNVDKVIGDLNLNLIDQIQDNNYNTLLHLAALENNLKRYNILLECGANPNILNYDRLSPGDILLRSITKDLISEAKTKSLDQLSYSRFDLKYHITVKEREKCQQIRKDNKINLKIYNPDNEKSLKLMQELNKLEDVMKSGDKDKQSEFIKDITEIYINRELLITSDEEIKRDLTSEISAKKKYYKKVSLDSPKNENMPYRGRNIYSNTRFESIQRDDPADIAKQLEKSLYIEEMD